MGNKKITYQEIAETMCGLVVDVKAISEKATGVLNKVKELPEPNNVRDEAVLHVILGTTEIFLGSLDNLLKVIEMYERSKYVVRKNKI